VSRPVRRAIAATLFSCTLAGVARGHDGPPYPVVVDRPFAGRTLSIWADPDVGIGTFYLYVEPEQGAEEAMLPLEIHAIPGNSRWTESSAEAKPASKNDAYQLIGEIAFEARGPWTVRFTHPASGEELTLEIEVTPPGSFGPIDILWFAFPFLALGFLWVKGVMRQRRYARGAGQPSIPRVLDSTP